MTNRSCFILSIFINIMFLVKLFKILISYFLLCLFTSNFMHCKCSQLCNCSNVIGSGKKCGFENFVNDTHSLVAFLCLPDRNQSWKKNIEIQFPKEPITIIKENKKYVKGFVKNISFEIYYFCKKPDKKIFFWPQPSKKEAKEIENYSHRSSNQIVKTKNFPGNMKVAFLMQDDTSKFCNFGKNKGVLLPHCNCNNVLGNGSKCEIITSLNGKNHYNILLCLIDKSQSWMKNIEAQFPKRSIVISEERNYSVKGFIGDHVTFYVNYFCKVAAKTMFEWPKQSDQGLQNNLTQNNLTQNNLTQNNLTQNNLTDSENVIECRKVNSWETAIPNYILIIIGCLVFVVVLILVLVAIFKLIRKLRSANTEFLQTSSKPCPETGAVLLPDLNENTREDNGDINQPLVLSKTEDQC